MKKRNPVGTTRSPYRACRGGGWRNSFAYCRSAVRGMYSPGIIFTGVGIRVIAIATKPRQ